VPETILLLSLLLHRAEGPEEFLQDLCDNRYGPEGALFWAAASASAEGIRPDADTLAACLAEQLAPLADLSVEPGARTLFEETDEGYLIEYAASSWTWTGPDGRVRRAEGPSRILWRDGEYYWLELPVMDRERSAGIGNRERMLSGLLFTAMILGFGVTAVLVARRGVPAGTG